MSWTRTTDPCACHCPGAASLALTVEYANIIYSEAAFSAGLAASFPAYGTTKTIGRDGEGNIIEGGYTGAEPVSMANVGEEYRRCKMRVKYTGDGKPVKLRTRLVTIADTIVGGFHTYSYTIGSEEVATDDGEEGVEATIYEQEITLPTVTGTALIEGPALTPSFVGYDGATTISVFSFGVKGATRSASKAGFHAYQEAAPVVSMVYRREEVSGGASGWQQYEITESDDYPGYVGTYTASLTNPQAVARVSPLFPSFRPPEPGMTQTAMTRVFAYRFGAITVTLSDEFTTEDLQSLVDDLVADHLDDTDDSSLIAYNFLSPDEVSYVRSKFKYRVQQAVSSGVLLYANADVTATVSWPVRTRDMETGIETETTLSQVVTFSVSPISPTDGTEYDLDPDEGTVQRIGRPTCAPVPEIVSPLLLEYDFEE